jgi:uncharacterized protein with PQ loop repeat
MHWGVYSRDPYKNATCNNVFSITTSGAYWTTWCSPTKFHIQAILINTVSHGQETYLPVLIIVFNFVLKCYFISKTFRCFWLTLYIYRILYNFQVTLYRPQNHNIMLCGTIYCTVS